MINRVRDILRRGGLSQVNLGKSLVFTLQDVRSNLGSVISLTMVLKDMATYHKYPEQVEQYSRVISILQLAREGVSPRKTLTSASLSKAINDILLAVKIIQDNKLAVDWKPLYDILPTIREIKKQFDG